MTLSPQEVSALVERLESWAKFTLSQNHAATLRTTVDALTALVRERGELREALEPLANLAGDVNMNDPLRKWLTVGQLHAACTALGGGE